MQEPSYSEVLHNCIIFQTAECMNTVPGILIAMLFFDVPAAVIVYIAKIVMFPLLLLVTSVA